MSMVLVDRELLERCVDRWACCSIVETPGAEQAWLELRAVLKTAQQHIIMPTDNDLESVLAEAEPFRDLSDVAYGWNEATECVARLNASNGLVNER